MNKDNQPSLKEILEKIISGISFKEEAIDSSENQISKDSDEFLQ